MAAHSVTALIELAQGFSFVATDERLAMLRAALDGSAPMAELPYQDWAWLSSSWKKTVSVKFEERGEATEQLHETILDILAGRLAEWQNLGRPKTHGEWVKAQEKRFRMIT